MCYDNSFRLVFADNPWPAWATQMEEKALPRFLRMVFLFLAAGMLAFASPLFTAGQVVDMQFIGPNGSSAGGIYVGPYNFLINGELVKLICDDPYPADQIGAGESWQAVVSFYPTLSMTRFGTRPDAVTLYGQTEALAYDMLTSSTSSVYADDHTALWNLVDPAYPMTPGAPARQTWAASQLPPSGVQYLMFTPIDANGQPLASGHQEHLGFQATPEPATFLLAGAALLAIGFRRKT